MSAPAQNSDTFWNVVALLIAAWWWVLPAVLGGLGVVYEFFHEVLKTHHKRRLAIEKERAKAARAIAEAEAHRTRMSLPYAPPAAIEKPGVRPCLHNRVVTPVISDGKRVAWYCPSCDQQLPADWALEPEDL